MGQYTGDIRRKDHFTTLS